MRVPSFLAVVSSLFGQTRDAELAPPRLVQATAQSLSVAWSAQPGASYELLSDDWWSSPGGAPSRSVYRGTAGAALLDDRVVPSAPVSLVLVAFDSAGAEVGRSAPATFNAAPQGECATDADASVWRDNRAHLRGDVTACLEDCALEGGECTEACVLKKNPFTPKCGACWSQFYDCAEAHCTVSCGFNPKGAKCHACTESSCTASGIACTGMPAWTWSD